MPKAAILIDGAFFSKAVGHALGTKWPLADVIYRNALKLKLADEDLLRIYFYDSKPYRGMQRNPISGVTVDYAASAGASARDRFLRELGQRDYIALRCGEVKPRGWILRDSYLAGLAGAAPRPPAATDYEMSFEQKGVDMRIGIDVATLALNRQADRIVIACNDTDLIPAFKLARRHGVQVALAKVGSFTPHPQLVEDADFTRAITPVA